MTAIKWPGGVFSADADDLGAPIRDMLIELHVLEKPDVEATLLGTPPSLQVITAGATTVAKGWTGVLALAGGGGALVSALSGIGLIPNDGANATVRAAFMISSAITLAAAVVAIALIVRADVVARATASQGQYAARARIAEVMLKTIGLAAPTAVAPVVAGYVASVNGSWVRIDKFALEGNELVAYVNGQRLTPSQMRGIVEVAAS